MSLLLKFRDWNVRTSCRTTPSSLFKTRGFAIYNFVARSLLADPKVKVVADIGGGRTWHFRDLFRAGGPKTIIGIDVDADELALNHDIDQKITTDVSKSLGIPDRSIDLILCRATIEHLPNNQSFLSNAYRALRPGGKAAFVFAGKWAPPMIMNRLLPTSAANKLLRALVPGTEGYGGFRAYYDLCTHSEFKKALLAEGFVIEHDYVSYYSSAYFQFFVPLHAISILLDHFRSILSIKDLASMNLFVVMRPLELSGPADAI